MALSSGLQTQSTEERIERKLPRVLKATESTPAQPMMATPHRTAQKLIIKLINNYKFFTVLTTAVLIFSVMKSIMADWTTVCMTFAESPASEAGYLCTAPAARTRAECRTTGQCSNETRTSRSASPSSVSASGRSPKWLLTCSVRPPGTAPGPC